MVKHTFFTLYRQFTPETHHGLFFEIHEHEIGAPNYRFQNTEILCKVHRDNKGICRIDSYKLDAGRMKWSTQFVHGYTVRCPRCMRDMAFENYGYG